MITQTAGAGGNWCLLATRGNGFTERLAAQLDQLGLTKKHARTGHDALALALDSEPPTLVVLGLELEDPSAYQVCRALREQFGETLPVVIAGSASADSHAETAALLLGADEYFASPIREEQVSARLRRLLSRARRQSERSGLTKREQEVLELLAQGHRIPEIAGLLCIAPKTAAKHIDHILSKLGVHSQSQAIALALREHLVNPV